MPMEPVWLQCGCCDTARRYGRCGSEIARDLESAASGLDWLTCLNCANTRGPRTLAGTATTRRASVASGGGTDAFRPVPRESHGGTGGRMNRGRESQGRSLSNTLVPARWGAYELQINNEDQKWATGSIENFIQRLVPVNPAPNEWHSYDVEVRGITWLRSWVEPRSWMAEIRSSGPATLRSTPQEQQDRVPPCQCQAVD